MAKKQEEKQPINSSLSKKEQEIARLMEKYPEETMSQVENRYGNGREKNGSDGSDSDASRIQH